MIPYNDDAVAASIHAVRFIQCAEVAVQFPDLLIDLPDDTAKVSAHWAVYGHFEMDRHDIYIEPILGASNSRRIPSNTTTMEANGAAVWASPNFNRPRINRISLA